MYVNASLKERLANINRFKAFQKVGKLIVSDVDFNDIIGSVPPRSDSDITQAQQALERPIDRVKWSLFWFANNHPADEVAIRNFKAGQPDKALNILDKYKTWSALLNFHVISLINRDYIGVGVAIDAMFNEGYIQNLIKDLGMDTIAFTLKELLIAYYKELSKNITIYDIVEAFKGLDCYAIISQEICNELQDELSHLIDMAKNTPKKDFSANFTAATSLVKFSEPILKQLKKVLTENSIYAIWADKVAQQILNNSINYYNNYFEQDAPRNTMPLLQFAMRIATGQTLNERIKENYDIIKTAYDSLPPEDALEDFNSVEFYLTRFGEETKSAELSLKLILNCELALGNLKEKCGLNHPAVLCLGTKIVKKALNSVNSSVNEAIKSLDGTSSYNNHTELAKVKEILKKAWTVYLHLDKLPIKNDTKEWYLNNRTTLNNILIDANINVAQSCGFEIRTEPEWFRLCTSKDHYQRYIERYKNPRYLRIAKQKIKEFEANEEIERKFRENKKLEKEAQEKALCDKIAAATLLEDLWKLLPSCTSYRCYDALDKRAWQLCEKKEDYISYSEHIPKGRYVKEAKLKSLPWIHRMLRYTTQRNKRIWKKIGLSIFMISTLCISQLIYFHLYYNSFYDVEWLLTSMRIFLCVAIVSIISMWSLEFQSDPTSPDIEWLANFTDKCNNLAEQLERLVVQDRKSYSWPLAFPVYLIELVAMIILYLFTGFRWLMAKIE